MAKGGSSSKFSTKLGRSVRLLRSPKVVLDNLAEKSKEEGYKFRRLYRNLYNPEFFYMAYEKIQGKPGNMTEGTDGKTIDGMSVRRIENLIERLKDYSYQPKPAKRVHIPKKNGETRPLGIPTVDDKLVQEVVRSILGAIFEGKFSEVSHGFRPNRSCHTALVDVLYKFNGAKWFIEGDIESFFDSIDHHVLIGLLRRHIEDEKFIDLIWKFLRAGYLEDWKFHGTYSGTPQGGIISPILANIYLNELDQYMKRYKEWFDKGTRHSRRSKEHKRYTERLYKLRKKLKANWNQMSDHEKKEARARIKELKQLQIQTPYYDPMDVNYRRIQYVRYADDFIIGVVGSKEDCIRIKNDLTSFLQKTLKLNLSQEKTLITHSSNNARFLGYDIKVRRDQTTKKNVNGIKQRSRSGDVQLLVPHEVWRKKLFDYLALKIDPKTGEWESTARTPLIRNDDLEILMTYNAEIRGLRNYYKLAHNIKALAKFKYIMEYSMYKTFASKYRTSVSKILNRYKINGKFAVRYETKGGTKIRWFYDEGFRKIQWNEISKMGQNVDLEYNTLNIRGSDNSLITRLKAQKCEWCGRDDKPIEIHHVRRLKDIRGKEMWERQMKSRNRKTMALCEDCHHNLHQGRLD